MHCHYHGSLLEAVEQTVSELRGSYGIAVIAAGDPGTVVAARQGSPLVVGLGENENFAASDAMAIAGETERFVYLAEGDVAEITPQTCRIFTRADGAWVPVEREVKVVHAYSGAVDLGPYRHYMQKETSSSRVPLPIRSRASMR